MNTSESELACMMGEVVTLWLVSILAGVDIVVGSGEWWGWSGVVTLSGVLVSGVGRHCFVETLCGLGESELRIVVDESG